MSPASFANVIASTSLHHYLLISSDWISGVRVDAVNGSTQSPSRLIARLRDNALMTELLDKGPKLT